MPTQKTEKQSSQSANRPGKILASGKNTPPAVIRKIEFLDSSRLKSVSLASNQFDWIIEFKDGSLYLMRGVGYVRFGEIACSISPGRFYQDLSKKYIVERLSN